MHKEYSLVLEQKRNMVSRFFPCPGLMMCLYYVRSLKGDTQAPPLSVTERELEEKPLFLEELT